MNDVFPDWTLTIILFAFMVAYTFLFGRFSVQAVARLFSKRKSSYRKWGVERDLFWPMPLVWFILYGFVFAIGTIFFFWIAFASTTLLPGVSNIGAEQFWDTFVIAFYGLMIGVIVEMVKFSGIDRKVKDLDALRNTFLERSSISDLLATYEALRPAPKLFWEEFTQLPDEDIGEDSNFRFRERAAPYRYTQSRQHNLTILAIAALTLAVSALLGGIQLFL